MKEKFPCIQFNSRVKNIIKRMKYYYANIFYNIWRHTDIQFPVKKLKTYETKKIQKIQVTKRDQLNHTVLKNPITILLWICRVLRTLITKKANQFVPRIISYNLINMWARITGTSRQHGRKPTKWQSNAVSQCQFFCDGRKLYQKCVVSGFSENDWVKWDLENQIVGYTRPYIGKIEFIGKPMDNVCSDSEIAVVIFEQDTSQLPGFVTHESGVFKNIISTSELENITAQEISQETSSLTLSIVGIDHLKNKFDRLSLSDPTSNNSCKAILKETINIDVFRAKLYLSKDQWFGIQGSDNSCYADACLFSLFAFNKTLDPSILIRTETINDASYFLKTVLRDIINHLRSDYLVEYSETRKLRLLLSQNYDKRFQKAFMDAEDFLLTLFEGINAAGMFEYANGYSDHVHQIILPSDWDLSHKVESMTVQKLVENSFRASGVKLKCQPDGLFIIKLPVSNGELIPCKYIIPNLKLDFSTILSPETCDAQADTTASLSAVICFRHCHYVAFSRANVKENSPWVFMDSNSITGSPKVVVLDHLDSILNGALTHESEFSKNSWEGIPNIEKCYSIRLLTDAYICVYDSGKPSVL